MTNLHSLITLCRQSARRALQWRLLVLYLLALLPPVALLAFPAWTVLDDQLSHSVHAAALAQQLDLSAITDLLAAGQRQALAVKVALAAALACTALLSPLLAGATFTAARGMTPRPGFPLSGATHAAGMPPAGQLALKAQPGGPLSDGPPAAPLSFGALLAGGIAEYPRMLRMLLWSAAVMGAVLATGALLIEWAQPQEALLPDEGKIAVYAARAVSALLVWFAVAGIDAGRAVLAADRRRHSVIHAWWLGVVLLWRHPLLALGSYALLGVMGFAMAGLIGLARLHVPAGALAGDVAGVLLTQALVLVLAWFRCARLFALLAVARP